MLILYRLHAYNYLLMLKNNVADFFITVIIENKPNYKGIAVYEKSIFCFFYFAMLNIACKK